MNKLKKTSDFSKKTVIAPNTYGFTLLELLVVIAIIGTLASVVMLSINSARAKSRDTKRFTDLSQLAKGFELYYNDKNVYPTVAAGGVLDTVLSAYVEPKYFATLPNSPLPPDGPCTSAPPTGPGTLANNYYYEAALNGSFFTITFCLGNNGPKGYGPGVHYLTPSGIK